MKQEDIISVYDMIPRVDRFENLDLEVIHSVFESMKMDFGGDFLNKKYLELTHNSQFDLTATIIILCLDYLRKNKIIFNETE